MVNEFLNSSYKTEIIYAEKKWISQQPQLSAEIEIVEVPADDLSRISFLKNAHSVLAVLKIPDQQSPPNPDGKITLMLDDLQDPGNLGTIIRIADWFGISNILCSPNTANCYNPKVVQATMGSLAHVQVHYLSLETFIAETKVPVFATSLDGESVYKTGTISEGIIVIGNEGKGISETLMSHAQNKISIPKTGQAESLNASVATGIILSHIVDHK